MQIPIYISITEERPAEMGVRTWRRLLSQAHREMGQKWYDEMAPRHFVSGASHRYGYQPRTPGYLRKKRKLAARGKVAAGGTVDLVFSGLMKDLVLSLVVIDATYKHALVRMQAPSYVTLKPNVFRGSVQPDKYREVITTTETEQRVLAGVQERAVKRLNDFRAKQVTLKA